MSVRCNSSGRLTRMRLVYHHKLCGGVSQCRSSMSGIWAAGRAVVSVPLSESCALCRQNMRPELHTAAQSKSKTQNSVSSVDISQICKTMSTSSRQLTQSQQSHLRLSSEGQHCKQWSATDSPVLQVVLMYQVARACTYILR